MDQELLDRLQEQLTNCRLALISVERLLHELPDATKAHQRRVADLFDELAGLEAELLVQARGVPDGSAV